MSYKNKTKHLGIPVPGRKDRIQADMEMKKYTIIENALIAGMEGVMFVVFDDGSYRIEKETDKTYQVVLEATGASPSAKGVVHGAYFDAPDTLRWEGLKTGFEHHLYLAGNVKTFENPAEVRTVSSIYPMEEGRGLLMAVADLRTEPTIELYPDGKVYSTDVAHHVSDKENPHGRVLFQDELVVNGKLYLNGEVQVEVEGEQVSFPASAFAGAVAELAGRKVHVIDMDSPGPEGLIKKIEGVRKVLFVEVTRRVTNGFSGMLGEVGIGYHSQDKSLDLANEFAIYNSEDEGLPIRVVALCG